MKIDSKFKLRKVAGENIIVNQGQVGADMTKIISLNSSASLLYKELEGKNFTVEDVAVILREAYEIEKDLAAKDAATWVEALKNCHVIVE